MAPTKPHQRLRKWLLLLPFAPSLSACEGCLALDEYTLVQSDGALGSGGSGGSSGTAPTGCEPGVFEGNLFVSYVSNGGGSGASAGPCGASSGSGIELFALDPAQAGCRARTMILASSGASFESKPRVRHSAGSVAALAGSLTAGTLEFPPACDDGASVVLRQESGAQQTLFVARVRLEGTGFCSEWLRRAWTTEIAPPNPLGVHALEMATDGTVAIAGTLGDRTTLFEDAAQAAELRGGAFLASWSSGGSLRTKSALAWSGAGERLTALSSAGSSWLATGTLLAEDPQCHACSGVSHVSDPAGACPAGSGGADAAVDEAGTAGAGGIDASLGGAAGAEDAGEPDAAPADAGEDRRRVGADVLNAVLLLSQGDRCGQLESFGSDQLADDVQIGFGVSRTTQSCGAYFTGLAGRSAWRLLGSNANTSLAPSGDQVADGFIARLQGGQGVGCTTTRGPSFSMRFESSGVAVGEHVVAERCNDAATASLFVPSAAGESVELKLCRSSGGCSAATETLSLGPDAQDQVVVLEIGGSGDLRWHTSFGPVQRGPDAAQGSFVDRPDFDLALDARDHAYVVVRTSGALRTHNAQLTRCDGLEAASVPAGTWLIQLERGGSGARAACRWAKLLGP